MSRIQVARRSSQRKKILPQVDIFGSCTNKCRALISILLKPFWIYLCTDRNRKCCENRNKTGKTSILVSTTQCLCTISSHIDIDTPKNVCWHPSSSSHSISAPLCILQGETRRKVHSIGVLWGCDTWRSQGRTKGTSLVLEHPVEVTILVSLF